jgi:hypothetical protein
MDSNSDLRKAYTSLTKDVVDALNADSVVDFLFAAGVLSAADYDVLSEITERKKKTRKLLALLHSARHPAAFVKLHEAIKTDTAYGWLTKQIEDLKISLKGASDNASKHVERGKTLVPFVKNAIFW